MAKKAPRKSVRPRRSATGRFLKEAAARFGAPGRRQADLWPMLTKILANLLIITSAAVSMILSYGFGQKSNDPVIDARVRAERADADRRAREHEARLDQMLEKIEALGARK